MAMFLTRGSSWRVTAAPSRAIGCRPASRGLSTAVRAERESAFQPLRVAAATVAGGAVLAVAVAQGGGNAAVVERVAGWLVEHPAPLFLVNNPLKAAADRAFAGRYDEGAVAAELSGLISSGDVVLFGYGWDPAFTATAKRTLVRAGVENFVAVDLEKRPDGAALRAELGTLTGRTSIPNIFIGGESIGGLNDGTPGLRPLIAAGELEPRLAMLRTAGSDEASRVVESELHK